MQTKLEKALTVLANEIERKIRKVGYLGENRGLNILHDFKLEPRSVGCSNRMVYRIKYNNRFYVVKIPYNKCEWAIEQNSSEIEVWERASEELRNNLYRIYGYSEKRKVIIGEYLPLASHHIEISKKEYRKFLSSIRKLCKPCKVYIHDVDYYSCNVRRRKNGQLTICDYGYFGIYRNKPAQIQENLR